MPNNQDTERMLANALALLVALYSEKTHFVYELLQNAEDAGATHVRFIQYPDRLQVFHDGNPFTQEDLERLCDVGGFQPEAGKIGKFGIGFKSVFTICKELELYSAPENFRTDSNAPRYAKKISNYVMSNDIDHDLNMQSPFTTCFVFEYHHENENTNGNLRGRYYHSRKDLNEDLSRKLRALGSDVLLFTRKLKKIEYRIEVRDESGIYELDRIPLGKECQWVKSSRGEHYILFSRPTDDDPDHQVNVAFAVAPTKDGPAQCRECNKCSGIRAENRDIQDGNNGWEFSDKPGSPYIFTYFPTDVKSQLNFLVQAPYELTPNRQNLIQDSEMNDSLTMQLARLFHDAILFFRDRGWLSLKLLNRLPYDMDEDDENWVLNEISRIFRKMLREEEIYPTEDDGYVNKRNARIVRGASLVKYKDGNEQVSVFSSQLLKELLNNDEVAWLPLCLTETNPEFQKMYHFLTKHPDTLTEYQGISINVIKPADIAMLLDNNPEFIKYRDDEWIRGFYNFFNIPSNRPLLREGNALRRIPFIKTENAGFCSAYSTDNSPAVFIRPDLNLEFEGFKFVDSYFAKECPEFMGAIGIEEPKIFDKFLQELGNGNLDNWMLLKAAKEAINFWPTLDDQEKIRLRQSMYLKVLPGTDGRTIVPLKDNEVFREKDTVGVSIKDYLPLNHLSNVYILDESFYIEGGIGEEALRTLSQLGLKDSLYSGVAENAPWLMGKAICRNIGAFRKQMGILYLEKVLECISGGDQTKSATLLELLCNAEKHLYGQWERGKVAREPHEDKADILHDLSSKNWLFNSQGARVSPREITRSELAPRAYSRINRDSRLFDWLDFKRTDVEEERARYEEIVSLIPPALWNYLLNPGFIDFINDRIVNVPVTEEDDANQGNGPLFDE